MRFATIAAVGVIAASTAALAQVASTPTEQKVPAAGQTETGNDMAVPGGTGPVDDGTTAPANDAAANTTAPPANDVAPATPTTDSKAPRRRRR